MLNQKTFAKNVFFLFGFSFHEDSRFTGLQGKGEVFSLSPLYLFHPLHRHLDINPAITTEIAYSQQPVSNQELLVSECRLLTTKLRALEKILLKFHFEIGSRLAQVPVYVSYNLDPETMHINAFLISWLDRSFYAFRAFAVIGRALRKMVSDVAQLFRIGKNWHGIAS